MSSQLNQEAGADAPSRLHAPLESLFPVLTGKAVLVVGDFFLDDYLWLDSQLTEVSLETGLDAYQVVRKARFPGAAGTVVNNLHALGIGDIRVLGACGCDGEGYELRRCLNRMGVDTSGLIEHEDLFTPTYLKPMLRSPGDVPRELHRLDTKNRKALPKDLEDEIIRRLKSLIPRVDGVVVADQVQERNAGIVTDRIREEIARLALEYPAVVFFADSREYIGEFEAVLTKPNERELSGLFTIDPPEGMNERPLTELAAMGQDLSRRTAKAVFVTCGARGILLCTVLEAHLIPAVPVSGPIDIVGAGDATTSGILCGLISGLSMFESAQLGGLTSSVTIRKIGETGTASPEELLSAAAQSGLFSVSGVHPVLPEWQGRQRVGQGIEVVRSRPPGRICSVIFDFDGTLSLVRRGWQDVMIPFMVREIQSLATNESEDALYALVREFVFRLTGKQTIYQMMQLAEEVRKRGGSASSPEEYKAMYHALLWREVEGRVQGLRSGTIAPVDLLVQGSIDLLDALQERGVRLYLASGTDIGYVRDEADALGLSGYFGEHIYGALTRREDFSKRMVIRRILGEQGLSGAELVAFGDGYVEIEDACRAGGRTVGVASDEARPGMLDSWKRNRLISAGADIIVPAYAEAERLLDWIENGLQPGSPREHR